MNNSQSFTLYALSLAMIASAQAQERNSFVADSRMSIRYSQYYWNEDHGNGVGPTRDEWVQATLLSYKSGWYEDLVGLDYSYGLADALEVGNKATSISNLEAGDTVQSPHGIAKPVEAYLRGHLVGEAGEFNYGVGKKSRRYGLYFDDPISRILPPSTLGADMEYRFGGLEARYSYINGFSARNESGWADDLTNFSGEKIDAMRLYALNYSFDDGTQILAEYAESEDYLKASSIKIKHSFQLSADQFLDLYATHGMQQDAGKLFDYQGVPGLYEAENSHDARYIELSAKYRFGHAYAGVDYNKVSGDDFDRLFFSADHGTWNSSAKLFYYFGAENEEMYRVSAGTNFDFIGVPQLRLDSHYAFSDHAAGYNGFSRREFQTVLQYNFTGMLSGLGLAWLHNEFTTKGTPDQVNRFAASYGPAGIITHHANRFYMNYIYNF
ncbi:OprD family outer membrane porin [Pseudomonas sp. S9]|uniref:OprD family outer membrane porin n=1 Tax=Pseudomonas sp. S9 TaxID=686578 RepID=UPI000255718F|nr:OprD family outer membrane porin [Pseudomonas sp. S9]